MVYQWWQTASVYVFSRLKQSCLHTFLSRKWVGREFWWTHRGIRFVECIFSTKVHLITSPFLSAMAILTLLYWGFDAVVNITRNYCCFYNNCRLLVAVLYWNSFFESFLRAEWHSSPLCSVVSWGGMSNVGPLRKQHHHLEALSANQEAPVQPRGEGGHMSQRRRPIVFWCFL